MRETPVSVVARHLLAAVDAVEGAMQVLVGLVRQEHHSAVSKQHVRPARMKTLRAKKAGPVGDIVGNRAVGRQEAVGEAVARRRASPRQAPAPHRPAGRTSPGV